LKKKCATWAGLGDIDEVCPCLDFFIFFYFLPALGPLMCNIYAS
jgi:hypothetical protein